MDRRDRVAFGKHNLNNLNWLLLILVALSVSRTAVEASKVSDDPNDPCSTHALNAYQNCVSENACACQNCGDPSDPNWEITVPEPRSCFDLSQIFCPLVKCCSPCEHVLSFYHNCLAKEIAEIYLGPRHNCNLFICPMEASDSVCGPPGLQATPCDAEVTDYVDCVNGNTECADECSETLLSELDLQSNTRTCEELNQDIFCPLESCCADCSAELEAVATCAETEFASLGEFCPLDYCPTVKKPKPPKNRTEAPATSSQSALEASRSGSTSHRRFPQWCLGTLSAVLLGISYFGL